MDSINKFFNKIKEKVEESKKNKKKVAVEKISVPTAPSGNTKKNKKKHKNKNKGEAITTKIPPDSLTQQHLPQQPKQSPQKTKEPPQNQNKAASADSAFQAERTRFEQLISSFVSSDLITVQIPSKTNENFYQEITEPTTLKLVMMVNDKNQRVNFKFSGPTDKSALFSTIVEKKNINFFSYEFPAEIPGKYRFTIINSQNVSPAFVIFGLNLGIKEHLQSKDVDQVSELIKKLDGKVNEMRMKGNLIVKKIETHNYKAEGHNKKIAVFSVIETSIMVLVYFVQVGYIKKMVEKL